DAQSAEAENPEPLIDDRPRILRGTHLGGLNWMENRRADLPRRLHQLILVLQTCAGLELLRRIARERARCGKPARKTDREAAALAPRSRPRLVASQSPCCVLLQLHRKWAEASQASVDLR